MCSVNVYLKHFTDSRALSFCTVESGYIYSWQVGTYRSSSAESAHFHSANLCKAHFNPSSFIIQRRIVITYESCVICWRIFFVILYDHVHSKATYGCRLSVSHYDLRLTEGKNKLPVHPILHWQILP